MGDPSACAPRGVLAFAAALTLKQPVADGEGTRADQDQQRDPGDRLGLERLIDELEGHRADQQPGAERHHHGDDSPAR
jgi:hypothetical protein